MARSSVGLIVLLLFLQLSVHIGCAKQEWGSFSRDICIKPGYRRYYSKLWHIEGDWQHACETTPAFVQDVFFPRPDECTRNWLTGEWGGFYLRDTSCDPWWHRIDDEHCERSQQIYHKYTSWLEHVEGRHWMDWCWQTPAVVRGIHFRTPSVCYQNIFHVYADFKVSDPCCSSPSDPDLRSSTSALAKRGNDRVGVCMAPENLHQWLELIHDEVEVQNERERQTCRWPLRAADVTEMLVAAHSSSYFNQRTGLIRNGEDTCHNDPDMPPFRIHGNVVTDMEGAVAEFGAETGIQTSRLLPYLWATVCRSIVRLTNATISTFYATIQQQAVNVNGNLEHVDYLQLQHTSSTNNRPSSSFSAMLVPSTRAERLLESQGILPAGSFATIEIGQPILASVISTSTFTGCTLVIGYDRNRRVLYMGHVEPSFDPPLQTCESVSNFMRMSGGFENVTLDRERDIYFFGPDDRYYSYNNAAANVIGFIHEDHVEMFFQITTRDFKEIIKSWIIYYD